MHHLMPPSKTGWQFKHCDFSTCDAPHNGRSKTVTTSEIIDQVQELILKDRRISAKSTAEHLDNLTWAGLVHHSWRFGNAEALRKVVPEIPERGWKKSMLPVVWETCGSRFGSARSKWFLSRLVTMDETWLYHYDPETKQQSMVW